MSLNTSLRRGLLLAEDLQEEEEESYIQPAVAVIYLQLVITVVTAYIHYEVLRGKDNRYEVVLITTRVACVLCLLYLTYYNIDRREDLFPA